MFSSPLLHSGSAVLNYAPRSVLSPESARPASPPSGRPCTSRSPERSQAHEYPRVSGEDPARQISASLSPAAAWPTRPTRPMKVAQGPGRRGLGREVADPCRRPRRRAASRTIPTARAACASSSRWRRSARTPAEMLGHVLITKQTGPGRQRGQAPLRRGRLRHQARALPRHADRSRHRPHHRRWPRPKAAWTSKRSPHKHPEKIIKQSRSIPATGLLPFFAPQGRLRASSLSGKQIGAARQVPDRDCTRPSWSSTPRSSRSTR